MTLELSNMPATRARADQIINMYRVVFLSSNYRLIVALWKFEVLKKFEFEI